ncbi:hypothetical protein AQ1_01973 [alpha proteobacterium Q-1]|nr:hypothetical protein AQ1_01973 [alpha proteobacterium Q-1]
MMAARGDIKLRLPLCAAPLIAPLIALHKNGGDDSNIGQMRAAIEGIVHHHRITGMKLPRKGGHHCLYAFPHRAQMHRHMGGIGDQIAIAIKHRAGKIEPFLHIHRMGGAGQHHPHIFRHAHEQIIEHLEQHRIGLILITRAHPACRHPLHQQIIAIGTHRLPAGLHPIGSGIIQNDRGPCYGAIHRQILPPIERRL